ncbi:MAG: hypothetical protein F4Z74_03055 [Acidobacteria bacterium]|nr:hypothetical protein [Acidobacteriota bacterium]MYE43057.1 hypothetical protein [Acidobacteriota bacterium]MYG74617.1 hypothetical protein [Acidobacteriota bacterium]
MATTPPARSRQPEKTLLLGTVAALVAVFLSPADLAAQRREPIPSPFAPLGIQRMSELATQVVAGTIERMESTWNHDHSRIYTRVTMRVERVLSGQAGRRIVFRIPGGTVGDTTVMVSEMPHFREGEDTVVFLRGSRGRLPSVLGGVEGKMPLARADDGSLSLLFPIQLASDGDASAATRELEDLESLVRGHALRR